MNIVLTGFMAAGKSAVGRELARLTGKAFADTDKMVVEAAGRPISRIFKEEGEAAFRALEKVAVKKAAAFEDMIISTGGGVVLDRENIEALRQNGVIVNLAPTIEIILSRLDPSAAAGRPLVNGRPPEQIRARYEERRPFYDNCDVQVVIDKEVPVAETAKRVLSEIERFLHRSTIK